MAAGKKTFCEEEKDAKAEFEADYAPLLFLKMQVLGKTVYGLLDSGCTHTMVSEDLVDDLQLKPTDLVAPVVITIGNGSKMRLKKGVRGLRCRAGELAFSLNALVAAVPFDLILGLPFVVNERLFAIYKPPILVGWRGGKRINLPLILGESGEEQQAREDVEAVQVTRQQARQAHDEF